MGRDLLHGRAYLTLLTRLTQRGHDDPRELRGRCRQREVLCNRPTGKREVHCLCPVSDSTRRHANELSNRSGSGYGEGVPSVGIRVGADGDIGNRDTRPLEGGTRFRGDSAGYRRRLLRMRRSGRNGEEHTDSGEDTSEVTRHTVS